MGKNVKKMCVKSPLAAIHLHQVLIPSKWVITPPKTNISPGKKKQWLVRMIHFLLKCSHFLGEHVTFPGLFI